MRLALVCFALVGTAYAQDSEPNMSCVDRLQMPVYPPLAAAARISGSVVATVTLSPDGKIQNIGLELRSGTPNAKLILGDVVEKALRASSFRKTRDGTPVKLIFNFSFDSDPAKRVAFGYPNQFWISVLPPPGGIIGAP